MSNLSDDTLRRFDALNHWLGDLYGERTSFSTLLLDAGFSEAEIDQIKRDHLNEFLQALLDLLASYATANTDERSRYVIVQHYGLSDGKPLDFYTIGHNMGVAGERIRQLVSRALALYRAPERQAIFRADFAAIGRRLLDNKSSNQE